MVSVATAFSQKVYFVYIQADSEQPFSVKLNERIYQSSSTGYLILSKLRDSTYPVSVIFPQSKWPDQSFKIEVKAKDRGFLLKNFGEKGWGLYDLQSLSVQMSTTEIAVKSNTESQQVSAFTEVLSKAANDPSLREKPIAVKKEETIAPQNAVVREEKKAEPVIIQPAVVKEEAKKEEPPVAQETIQEKKQEEKAEEKQPETRFQEYRPSVVKRKSETSTSERFVINFIDEYSDGKKDTISIIIPNQRLAAVIGSKEQAKEDKKFIDVVEVKLDDGGKEDTKPPVSESAKETAKEVNKEPVKRSACSSMASESDFLKLRRKMAAESNDDDMVGEAAKFFKTKCFTVTQIKNLNTLFLNDSGKYKFFDAAYSHVADPDNFASLQAELKDEYYINRFKAMMR
jgi:hypothetical protein